jgi:DNA polymerase-3 subunit delta'
MPELVLHPITQLAVTEYIDRPSHALLVTGPAGSGKSSVARHLTTGVFDISAEKYTDHPYIRTIVSESNAAIPIEKIRELQKFLTLKIPGSSGIARAIVIEDAHLLTIEAQNALLKTLEEPPADTIVILTAPSTESVLPTIQSRARQLAVLPPQLEELERYFSTQGYGAEAVRRALMLSGDLPGLTAALLAEDMTHPLVEATAHARGILQSKTYERLLLVDGLIKQKQLCVDVLFVLGQMSRMALVKSTDSTAAKRWQRVLKASYNATEQLAHNTGAKLVLTNLMLEL